MEIPLGSSHALNKKRTTAHTAAGPHAKTVRFKPRRSRVTVLSSPHLRVAGIVGSARSLTSGRASGQENHLGLDRLPSPNRAITLLATGGGSSRTELNGQAGTDTINVRSTAATSVTNINGGGNTDTINISSNAPTNTGSLDGILGAICVNGDMHDAGTTTLVIKGVGNILAWSHVWKSGAIAEDIRPKLRLKYP